MKKILAIGAHFDDVELGCGGSLLNHAQNGDQILLYVATHSGYFGANGRQVRNAAQALEEGKKACSILGAQLVCGGFETCDLPSGDELVLSIRRVCEAHEFDLAYFHWTGDPHPDHRRLAAASLAAARHIKSLLMYRSNWYQGAEPFRGAVYRDISGVLEKKFALVRQFASEYSRAGDKWERYWRAEHAAAGAKIGAAAAEEFQPVRFVME